jgi:hypothetical protein
VNFILTFSPKVGLRHFGSLVLTQTTANNTYAKKYYNPKLLIPDAHFLQYAPPQFYSSDPSVPHHISAPTLHIYSFKYKHNYSAKLLAQRRIAHLPSSTKNQKPAFLFSPSIYLSIFQSINHLCHLHHWSAHPCPKIATLSSPT